MNDKDENPIVGLTSATVNEPNTANEFSFWLKPGKIINPFDIVEVEQVAQEGASWTFGIVNTLHHTTDARSHLSNFISNDFGQTDGSEPNTIRQGTIVARVGVLANDHDIYMPVVTDKTVRFADESGIHKALGIDQVPGDCQVPAGIIRMSNGEQAVVFLDSRYILGPEGAHVNITGISGLATKTSYAIFLIQSMIQRVQNRDNIGVIILNVKHGDLLAIDQPPAKPLSSEQRRLWDKMRLEPKPFDNVRYLLPHGKDTPSDDLPNSFLVPKHNWSIFGYSLQDAYNKLDLLFSNVPDPYETINSIIGEINQGLSDPVTGEWGPVGKWKDTVDWNYLLNGKPLFDPISGHAQQLGDIRTTSVSRFRRLLRAIVETRQSGLFVSNRNRDVRSLSREVGLIRPGETLVVDIAKLTDNEQSLVFGDILRTIYSLYSEAGVDRTDVPEKLIIFVDELNKYAPAGYQESPILHQVLDISERGRSLGVILVSAEQFMSEVHERVVGNCSTTVIGNSKSQELSAPAYRFLEPDVKSSVMRLEKGELVISHATFRQPVKIMFPLPAYKQEGVE